MRRLGDFLKNMFPVADLRQLLVPYTEMTEHDALRLCTGRVTSANVDIIRLASCKLRPIEVCTYQSDVDLRNQWRRSEDASNKAAHLTVILVLGDFLRGNLRELIRRQHPAQRLVIVPHLGHWPGLDSFGDLALSAGSLGWNSIELCRNWRGTSNTSARCTRGRERLLIFLPASTPVRDVM